MYKQAQKGFTLIELMIVIAIIGILAAVAVPQYQTYTKRAKFSEVVLATTEFKTPAEIAVQTGAATAKTDLNSGKLGIPEKVSSSGTNKPVGQHVTSVDMANGVITAVGASTVDSAKYVINATITNGGISWAMDLTDTVSTCLKSGYCSPQK